MAVKWADNVAESTTTIGTGTIDLDGADAGAQTVVSGIGNGSDCIYGIYSDSEWEVGFGTVIDATPDTLARSAVIASSNNNAAVNFSSGAKRVRLLPPFAIRATRLLDRDRDTKVDTDEGFADEDKIRFDTGGTERAVLDSTGFDLKSGEYKLAGKAVGWQLIESQTASNSSSLDFTTGIDSDHDLYMFVLSIVVPATGGANLRLRVSEDGGTTWKNGSADYE